MHTSKRTWIFLTACVGIAGALPRCSCNDGNGIQRAAVEMTLTFAEVDTCSGAVVPRRIPDDFERTGQPMITDFGSVGEREFEIRSTGNAPLNVVSAELSQETDEFKLEILDGEGMPVTLPATLPVAEIGAPPGVVLRVTYASQNADPDLVELVITSDDPVRKEIRFGLSAGRGKIEVCGTNGCVADAAIDFGDVSIDEASTETLIIKNVGEGDLDLRSIRLESASAEFCAPEATQLPEGVADCNQINQCMVLKPGEEYLVNITYQPLDGGRDTGKVVIASGDASSGTVEVPINGQGAGPAVCVCLFDGEGACNQTQLIDFGLADVGVGKPLRVGLESCGTESVDITEAMLELDPPFSTGSEYEITQSFTTGTLDPGEISEGVITYTPQAAGTHNGALRYQIAQTDVRFWIPITGQASTCDLEVLPQAVNFGTVAGGSSSERTVLLVNNGAKNCNVLEVTEPTDANFVIVNRPTGTATIAPGLDLPLTVRFTAPVGGVMPYSATFDVTSDEPGPGASTTVQLEALGGGSPVCEIEVSPSGNSLLPIRDGLLQFGAVNIGYDKTLAIRVENVGNTDCVLQSYQLTTNAPTEFTAASARSLPMSFSSGQVAVIEVTFAPTMTPLTGIYSSFAHHVDFSVAGPGLTQTDWSIGINARPTEPTIDVLPPDVDFGLVTWERPQAPDNRSSCGSRARSVNIYNSGTGVLTVTAIDIDPTSDPVFLISDVIQNGSSLSAPYTNIAIAAGGSIEVQLRFFPTRANPAEHQGLLVIDNDVTNAGGSGAPLTVPLRGEGTTNSNQTDVFDQLTDNKIDILWVVDDSASMGEEQSSLASNFQSFIGFADSLGVDYQIGITTTEVNDQSAGKLWACNGFNTILTPSDANRVAAFECAANVTNPPNGNDPPNPDGSDEQEAGLQAARMALDVPIVDNENAGFLRDDARLAVIMVSDEEDQSDGSINLYVDFFRGLKGFHNPQLVSVSSIAGDVPGGCATAEEGRRYRDASQQLGGQFESICTSSWNAMLQNIGLGVFALRRAWVLSRQADENSISVTVDGMSVPLSGMNGWTYDAASNTVTFNGSSVPEPGSTVQVQYGAICIP